MRSWAGEARAGYHDLELDARGEQLAGAQLEELDEDVVQVVEVQQLLLALLLALLLRDLELDDLAEEVAERLDVLVARLGEEEVEALDDDLVHDVAAAVQLADQLDVADDLLLLLVLDLLLVEDEQHALREVALVVAHAVLVELLVALLHEQLLEVQLRLRLVVELAEQLNAQVAVQLDVVRLRRRLQEQDFLRAQPRPLTLSSFSSDGVKFVFRRIFSVMSWKLFGDSLFSSCRSFFTFSLNALYRPCGLFRTFHPSSVLLAAFSIGRKIMLFLCGKSSGFIPHGRSRYSSRSYIMKSNVKLNLSSFSRDALAGT